MSDLLTHLRAENAKKEAWMAEGEGRWTGLWTEDLAHWAEYGVYTAEQWETHIQRETYVDYFKEVMGFKPYTDTSEWTDEQWEAAFSSLDAEAEWQAKRQAADDAAAEAEFEAEIAQCIELGAADRATALRWLTSEEEEGFYMQQCVEHWVYKRGLLYTEYGKALVKELMGIVTLKEWEEA